MLCWVVAWVLVAGLPKNNELLLVDVILDPVKMHVNSPTTLLFDSSVRLSCHSGLEQVVGAMSSDVWRGGTPSLALMKRAPHSSSAAEDITQPRMLDTAWMAPLSMAGLSEGLLLRKKCPPGWLRCFSS